MTARPYRITCVCTGNICRSPMAERVLERALEEAGLAGRVAVDSAGTMGWHEGNDAHANTVTILERAGYRSHGHRARHLTEDLFTATDLVLLMDRGHRQDLRSVGFVDGPDVRLWRSFDPIARASGELDVPDPWGHEEPTYEETLAMLRSALPDLVDFIRGQVELIAQP